MFVKKLEILDTQTKREFGLISTFINGIINIDF